MNIDLFGHVLTGSCLPAGLGRRDHLTFRGNVAVGRHGWLRLTPAYSLHLVRELLRRCGPDDLVLDPFSGTGTTPLACAAMGIRCHAVDINPFLVWLGNLKLSRFPQGTSRAVGTAAADVTDAAHNARNGSWRPDLHAIEKWWDEPTLDALAALWHALRHPAHPCAESVSDLLRVAFCRVMIQSANVSFGHQSMSFKKTGKDAVPSLLTEKHALSTAPIARLFGAAAREIGESLAVEPPSADGRVFLGDSRDLLAVLPERGYTTVITSPPYPNRMSYIRELRPYMYWLGYLSDGRAAGELDWRAIGGTWGCATSMLNAWRPTTQGDIPFARFDDIVEGIGKRHALLGRYVHKYFVDIREHILALREVLAPGARCHYIVGNSKFYETMLPVEGIYAALFEDAGFVDVRVDTIRKRTSKKELFEFIVHARRP
ncbi:MAG TPA: SAM-dependent methyltransferase [Phycisphaerae bacterium]|nr:SAM-dependent methyltransferase [Phycisphaerae bacterium]HNU45735.1 SAM-dependent methyltransferase [Phycisphaerae bacterium]